jgi:hypothetical protein
MRVQIVKSIGAVSLLAAFCFVAEPGARSAPALKPQCDQKCHTTAGTFLDSDPLDPNRCVRYTEQTCHHCPGGANGSPCEPRIPVEPASCAQVFIEEPIDPNDPSLGTEWRHATISGYLYVPLENGDLPCACICANVNSPCEAKAPAGAAVDPTATLIFKKKCE